MGLPKQKELIMMKVKIFYAGAGGSAHDLGISASAFKIWTGEPFEGYTSAASMGIFGAAVIETPIIDITVDDPETENLFLNLHGRTVHVKLEPTVFFHYGGIVEVTLTIKQQNGSSTVDKKINFEATDCRGGAETLGAIDFTLELTQLPQSEWNPPTQIVP
ncbi:hypothetical protein PDK11_25095 [Bacillus cereus]|nr:hypothetical protein [Bacillus cereus]